MKIKDAIYMANLMEQGNVLPKELAILFLSELDGMIQSDIMLHAPEEIVSYDSEEQELLLRPPHDKLYVHYLVMMIRNQQQEYEGYQNSQASVDEKLKTFRRWYVQHYRPADSLSDNGAVSEPGTWGFAYITAYGLAVQRGYRGTLEEWLESLKGDPGEPARMRYDAQRETIQWGVGETWYDLFSLQELRDPVVEAFLQEAEAAAAAAGQSAAAAAESAHVAGRTADSAADYAIQANESAGKAAGSAQSAEAERKVAEIAAADAKNAELNAKAAEDAALRASGEAAGYAQSAQEAKEAAEAAAKRAEDAANGVQDITWSTLEGKPFYEAELTRTIVLDYNSGVEIEVAGGVLRRVSTETPAAEELVGAMAEVDSQGNLYAAEISKLHREDNYIAFGTDASYQMIVISGRIELEGTVIDPPTPGIYTVAPTGEPTRDVITKIRMAVGTQEKLLVDRLPDGGFGCEQTMFVEMTWDGDTEGRDKVQVLDYGDPVWLYKISDAAPDHLDLTGGTIAVTYSGTGEITESVIPAGAVYSQNGLTALGPEIVVFHRTDASIERFSLTAPAPGTTVPSTGTYVVLTDYGYISRISARGTAIRKIEERFISDSIARREDLPKLDETLSQSGKAADAKAVGDAFSRLSGQTATWDTLEGKPVYVHTGPRVVEWNGAMDGDRFVTGSGGYAANWLKISDAVPGKEELIGAEFTHSSEWLHLGPIAAIEDGVGCYGSNDYGILVVTQTGQIEDYFGREGTAPSTGIYVRPEAYAGQDSPYLRLAYGEYSQEKFDPAWLPDGGFGWEGPGGKTDILPETELTLEPLDEAAPDGTILYMCQFYPLIHGAQLKVGAKCQVVIDGVTSEATVGDMMPGSELPYLYLGNLALGEMGEDTGEDWLFYATQHPDYAWIGIFGTRRGDIKTLAISTEGTVVHQILDKFIPPSVARKGDVKWEAIPDKPFGVTVTSLAAPMTLAEMRYNGSYTYGIGFLPQRITAGERYLVSVDGEITEWVAQQYFGGIYLGADPRAFNYVDTLPAGAYSIWEHDNTLTVYLLGNRVQAVIGVAHVEIKYIDERVIPDSIARKADIPIIPDVGASPAIIDVVELPTENIREDCFYRLLSGSLAIDQYAQNMYTVHCVETLPESGLPATNIDQTEGNVYYSVPDGEAYGYVDDILSAGLGVPAGWYPAATLLGAFGFEYGGVITNILDDPMDDKIRLLLEYVVYDHKDGSWTSHKKIGWVGTGASAEIFNHPGNIASGTVSHAEGLETTASGTVSHAEGEETTASGSWSHAEGYASLAEGNESHAEGHSSHAEGRSSHAEGLSSHAEGDSSHAEGDSSHAEGDSSHAEGSDTHAEGSNTHAEGQYSHAVGRSQHVQGECNLIDPEYNPDKPSSRAKYAHIVGNGTDRNNRSNAHTLDWEGNAWYQGDVYVYGTGQDDAAARKLATEERVSELINESLGPIEAALAEI